MADIYWIRKGLSNHFPVADLKKGIDLNRNGVIEESERTDLNGDGVVSVKEWENFLKKNEAPLTKLGGFFKYYYSWGQTFGPNNPIHDLLSIESVLFKPAEIEKAYAKVKQILKTYKSFEDVVRKIRKKELPPEVKLFNLSLSMSVLGIKFEDQETSSFIENIDHDSLDCDTTGFAILPIAHELSWPVYFVVAPGHAFTRWEDGKIRLNFEPIGSLIVDSSTQKATTPKDQFYIQRKNIHKKAIEEGVYLTNLSRKQIVSYILASRGIERMRRGDLKGAIRDFSEALSPELDPKNIYALAHRGAAYAKLKKDVDALNDFRAALKLHPNERAALIAIAGIKAQSGQYEEAMAYINRFIKLTTEEHEKILGYALRAMIFMQMGKSEEAEKDLKKITG